VFIVRNAFSGVWNCANESDFSSPKTVLKTQALGGAGFSVAGSLAGLVADEVFMEATVNITATEISSRTTVITEDDFVFMTIVFNF
jgi:hypothetical protein